MVMPGDNINMDVELITPIACEEGLRFAIREGGRTVGAGVVTKILGVRPWPPSESSSRSSARICSERNYSTTKNKRANAEKLELTKFCRAAASTRLTRKRSETTRPRAIELGAVGLSEAHGHEVDCRCMRPIV